jgi:hypothetical protein
LTVKFFRRGIMGKNTDEKEIIYIEHENFHFETGFSKQNEIDVIDGIKIYNPLHKKLRRL